MSILMYALPEMLYSVFCYIFLYKIMTMDNQSMARKRKIAFFIAVCIFFFVDVLLFVYFPTKNEFGEIRHLPGFFEYIAMIFILLVLCKNEIIRNAYYAVFGYVLIMSVELIVKILFNQNYMLFQNSWVLLILKSFLLFAYLLALRKVNKDNKNDYKNKDWFMFLLMTIIGGAYLYYLTEVVYFLDFQDMNVINKFEMIQLGFLIVIYIVFYIYLKTLGVRNYQLKEVELQLDIQKQQKQLLSDISSANEENRKLRHDLKYHFAAIENLIDEYPHEVKPYIKKLNQQIKIIKMISTNNHSLDYVINSKLAVCHRANIKFTYDIQDNLCQLQDFDLISLLSNILDNAIEAQKVYEGTSWITLSLYDKGTSTEINTINTCNENMILKIGKDLKTSKTDKEHHGIGMKRIESLADKYKGLVDIKIQNDIFQIKVWIPKQ